VLESCLDVELCALIECFLVILPNENVLENLASVREAELVPFAEVAHDFEGPRA
jgi:hypothetical protein